jgi:hypothetical protein
LLEKFEGQPRRGPRTCDRVESPSYTRRYERAVN